jgi:hypothetical protein
MAQQRRNAFTRVGRRTPDGASGKRCLTEGPERANMKALRRDFGPDVLRPYLRKSRAIVDDPPYSPCCW